MGILAMVSAGSGLYPAPTTAPRPSSQCVEMMARSTGLEGMSLYARPVATDCRNDCELRKINCGDDVSSVGWENCRFNTGLSTCQHHCDKEPDMVSGQEQEQEQ